MRTLALAALCSLPLCAATSRAHAQTVAPPYNTWYTVQDLGSAAGVPANYAGLTFMAGDPNFLLLGGNGNTASGALYKVRVTRDAKNHVTGFTGSATRHADAAHNDGGVAYGPGNILFLTRYPVHELGQTRPGSNVTDKIVPLTPLGMPASVGALTFVPPKFPGEGTLKLVSYNSGAFRSGTLAPDASGTYDLTGLTGNVTLGGGPDGLVYVPPGSPLFPDYSSLLVCEYSLGAVAVYQIDLAGDPIPSTRQDFITGLTNVAGATIDPATGDFFFCTFGGGNRVVVVRGFASPCASFTNYGTGLAGSGGLVPALGGSGCAARNLTIAFEVGNGLGGAGGVLVIGASQTSIPLMGGTLLVAPLLTVPHVLAGAVSVPGAGTISIPNKVPDDATMVGIDFFAQGFYLDPGAAQLVAMTPGLRSQIR